MSGMKEENPYEAPEAELERIPDSNEASFALAATPRSNSIGHGWTWIAGGFGYFRKSWLSWIGAMLLGFVIMVVVALIPFVNWLFELLTPFIWIAGLALGCRAQAKGLPFKVSHLWAGFTSRVGMLILLAIVFNIAIVAILLATLGPVFFDTLNSAPGTVVDWNPRDMLLRILVALLFVLPLFMATFFAPHLIVFHDLTLFRAIQLSFIGCLKNLLPFLWWGIVMAFLTLVAMLPLGLGLLVVTPVSFASIYVAYEDIFLQDSISPI